MAIIKNVYIVDKNTLKLGENASIGDTINLLELNKVDTTIIEEKIKNKIDEVYSQKVNEVIKQKDLECDNKELKIRNEYAEEISQLKELLVTKEAEVTSKLQISYNDQINALKTEIEGCKTQTLLAKEQEKLEIEKALLESEKVWQEKIRLCEEKYTQELNDKNESIQRLTLAKSNLNVKKIGERLEHWCNNEYQTYALNGFSTCTWEKDNTTVKNDDDSKGTKADYIFKVYSSTPFNEHHLLTSVACEMKSEDPSSVNKKKNSDHYKKLDSDRIKKNCEYALLVSELEWEDANDVPIRKVAEYDQMYVVRPQYFVTFLSIVTSLGKKYQELLLEEEKTQEKFRDTNEILEEFDKMKKDILDSQLQKLHNEIENINKLNATIILSANKIYESTSKMTNTILENIHKKIDNFKIQKVIKQINKIQE